MYSLKSYFLVTAAGKENRATPASKRVKTAASKGTRGKSTSKVKKTGE